MNRSTWTLGLTALLAMTAFGPLTGCDTPAPEDAADDSFTAAGKADGLAVDGSPEARGVLRVANTLSQEQLDDDARLDRRAAEHIAEFRMGEDGWFDDLAELDAIKWVGPRAYGKMLAYAEEHGYIHDHVFPPSNDELPVEYLGPRFQMSQDYPLSMDEAVHEVQRGLLDTGLLEGRPSANVLDDLPWTDIDFRVDPDAYTFALRSYVFRSLGIFDANDQVIGDGPALLNPAMGWYSMPWMHDGPRGREATHGLTRELDSNLGYEGGERFQSWGVGYYNALGGLTIGQVWQDLDHADITGQNPQFPEGTVVTKMLFTSGTPETAPWTEGAFTWDAFINQTRSTSSPRTIRPVRLAQIDIAVKDWRASETGWVFATLVYDPSATEAARGKTDDTPFHRMVPVGLAYGNDPGITPEAVAEGLALEESRVSAHIPEHAQQTLGWGGRLNGPLDNSRSACMSCHAAAQWPNVQYMTPAPFHTSEERLPWFRNLGGTESFDEGRVALDYSMQMAIALRNCRLAEDETFACTIDGEP